MARISFAHINLIAKRLMKLRQPWVRVLFVALLVVCLSPFADASDLLLQIDTDIRVRTPVAGVYAKDGGILKAGSVVAIPEAYVVNNSEGKPDLRLTLGKWYMKAPAGEEKVNLLRYDYAQSSDFFFPVKVRYTAPGSTVGLGEATPHLALRQVAKVGLWATLNEDKLNDHAALSEASRKRRAAFVARSRAAAYGLEASAPCPGGCTPLRSDSAAGNLTTIPSMSSRGKDVKIFSSRSLFTAVLTSPRTPLGPVPRPKRIKGSRGSTVKSYAVAPACSHIMSPTGQIGNGGAAMTKILTSPAYAPSYLAPNAMGRLCPNFSRLSNTEKVKAWLWFWTALGNEESKCQLTVRHSTHAGRRRINPYEGYGIWALEIDKKLRAWRGRACQNLSSFNGQALCAIDIMQKLQLKKGFSAETGGEFIYWGPVRRYPVQILPHMTRFKACFN